MSGTQSNLMLHTLPLHDEDIVKSQEQYTARNVSKLAKGLDN